MSVAGSALPGIETDQVRHWLAENVDGLVGFDTRQRRSGDRHAPSMNVDPLPGQWCP